MDGKEESCDRKGRTLGAKHFLESKETFESLSVHISDTNRT